MSSILVTKGPAAEGGFSAALAQMGFVPTAQRFDGRAASFRFGLSWVDSTSTPVHHSPESGLSVVMLGRVYDSNDVRYDHKLAELAEDYRRRGPDALHPFNGGGALVLFDHREDACFIATDPIGAFPLYAAFPHDRSKTAVGTHTDLLASCFDCDLPLDPVTMAELLVAGCGVHPHTYYQDIQQMDPGSLFRWDSQGLRKVLTYWQPEVRLDTTSTVDELAEELAAAVRAAVDTRMKNVPGSVGVLLSGGLDSRTMLFGAGSPERMLGITFANEVNREVRYAQRLARLAGARHLLLKRDDDYYGTVAVKAVQVSGGIWDFAHAHTLGFADRINGEVDLLLSGCYMDILFKAYALDTERGAPSLLSLPKQRLAPFRFAWGEPHFPIQNETLAARVRERLEALYGGLDLSNPTPETRLAEQYRRLRPMCREHCAAFRMSMWRTVPFDPVTADLRILRMVERIPPEMTLDRQLALKLLARLSPKALTVPDANTGQIGVGFSPAGIGRRALQRASRVARRVTGKKSFVANDGQGSWIDWAHYIGQSDLIRDLWREAQRTHGDQITEILGYDPFQRPLADFARDERLFTRILTLGLWLEHRIRRTGRREEAARPGNGQT